MLGEILFLVFLTMLNAFFASSEMALVSLNKNHITRLAAAGNKKAKLLRSLMDEPTKFLSTIQIGITLGGFFASASAATGISDDLAVVMTGLHIPYSNEIAMVVVTLILSYFTLVLGELYPKRVAMQKAEAISMFTVMPVYYLSKVFSPFIKLLSLSTTFVLKITGMKNVDEEETVSKEEIKYIIQAGEVNGTIDKRERGMIEGVFQLSQKKAVQIMTPRNQMYAIDVEDDISEYLDEMLNENYSRVPVYQENKDNIIGILYLKDYLLKARKYGFEHVDIRKIMKEPFFIPNTKNVDKLLKEMQSNKTHIAILIDEYGGVSGIVTMEDLVEEVMGNIDDEYDDSHSKFQIPQLSRNFIK